MATKNKYSKQLPAKLDYIDVYDVLRLFDVVEPALQHAIKKLLMPGKRGKGDYEQDLREAIQSITRAIEMHEEYDTKQFGPVHEFTNTTTSGITEHE